MKKYAFVNAEGRAAYTAIPSDQDVFEDGQEHFGLTVRAIPFESDDGEVISSWYWAGAVQKVLPPCPSEVHSWDLATEQWLDKRTEPEKQAALWAQAKIERTQEIFAPLTTPHGVFDADVWSQKNITDAILYLQLANAAATIDFTLADNTVVALTLEQLIEVGTLLGQRTQAAHDKARQRREEIFGAN